MEGERLGAGGCDAVRGMRVKVRVTRESDCGRGFRQVTGGDEAGGGWHATALELDFESDQ